MFFGLLLSWSPLIWMVQAGITCAATIVRLQHAYVQNKQRVSCQAKFKQPLAFSEVRKNMRSCVSFSSHFLSHTVSNDSRRRSPHNCTTEEIDRNSHRADRRSAFGPLYLTFLATLSPLWVKRLYERIMYVWLMFVSCACVYDTTTS